MHSAEGTAAAVRGPVPAAGRGRGLPALWRERPEWVAAVAGAALTVGFVVLAAGPARDLLYAVGTWAPVAAVAAGLRRHRPARAGFWRLLAAGLAVNALGEMVFVFYLHGLDRSPFPGPASVCYVVAYALVAAAMVGAGRARSSARRDRGRAGPRSGLGARGVLDPGGVLDAATVTVGLGLPMWLFLVRPAVSDAGVPLAERLAVAAYSLGAAVVAAQLLGLLTASGRPPVALRLLAVAGALGLSSTLAYQVLTLLGSSPYAWVNPGLLLTFTLVSAAALHPSMRRLGGAAGPDEGTAAVGATPSAARMALLGGAVLVAPASIAFRLHTSATVDAADGWPILAGGGAVSLLVLGRMAVLLGQVHAQARQLAALAGTDPLTGLPNRRALQAAMDAALADAGRDRHAGDARGQLAVVVLDLDHFKAVNDTHGHAGGDAVLRGATRAWRGRLRPADVLARLGGEEFAALLPATALPAALAVAEDLRRATPAGVTVSAGVAAWAGEGSADLLARADRALYRAKRGGRDRVVCAEAPDQPRRRGQQGALA